MPISSSCYTLHQEGSRNLWKFVCILQEVTYNSLIHFKITEPNKNLKHQRPMKKWVMILFLKLQHKLKIWWDTPFNPGPTAHPAITGSCGTKPPDTEAMSTSSRILVITLTSRLPGIYYTNTVQQRGNKNLVNEIFIYIDSQKKLTKMQKFDCTVLYKTFRTTRRLQYFT